MPKLLNYFLLIVVLIFLVLVFLQSCEVARADTIPIWKVLLAEAVGEGPKGMYAVACVIRNRGGTIDGFAGAERKDLDAFCDRCGPLFKALAKAIERRVFEEKSEDITYGATHYENVERFGLPYWAKNMKVTCKIGRHTFYASR